ncbi:MAG: NAD(P)H-binding protein [Alcanivoracaceae bacterium]|nr:NAD(P)H-binding protein [Alcanivoracaceae bacterium]
MNILITGASGFIGDSILTALVKNNHNISACIHKSNLPHNVKTIKLDFTNMQNPQSWLPFLDNIDVVINCVGIIAETKNQCFKVMHHLTPVAMFKACEQTGVKRVIQISALGADNKSLVAFHISKKKADDYLRDSQLDWFVLRPSLVYGNNGKSYKFFQWLSNLIIIPLIGSGKQLIQPVPIDTLVTVVKKCIQTSATKQTLDVVGEKAISYKDWMVIIRLRKSKARFIQIPMALIKIIAYLSKPFKLQLLSKDNITMLEQNNIGDYPTLKNFMENTI